MEPTPSPALPTAEAMESLLRQCLDLPDGAPLSDETAAALDEAAAAYPSSALLTLLQLRHCPASDGDRREELRRRLALQSPCRRTVAFGDFGADWADFYPEVEANPTPDTVDVIDTFLSTYGSCTPEEEALLERMIFNPTPDYAEMLAREEQESLPEAAAAGGDSHEAMINAFILNRHPAAHAPTLMPEPSLAASGDADAVPDAPVARPEPAADGLLSESLARIFIKQGRYERAYEIISGLNLKFPKKSAYFADQLRFLQKLIINRRRMEGLAPDGDQ